jgi:7-cyano-7-deazaguanine tRNA-ribosyltransferase
MAEFELLERDGFARIGRLATPHGSIETPALLPVIHPDPARQPIPAPEIRDRFGFRAFITSSYICWRSSQLKARAAAEGIHRLLGVDSPVMTDSGAFQQHTYGHVEVGADEILEFQERIGSDIATVLDIFVEPSASLDETRQAVQETRQRTERARERHEGLLAAPVQGGHFPELRRESALAASQAGDILAIGGIVPLMEQYRFAELARILLAVRPALAPERLVHLFGAGHPLLFAFGALVGADLFDSSSYHKFARRGSVLLPSGTIPLETIREPICHCFLCQEIPLRRLNELDRVQRESHLARHNLLVCAEEMGRVRQAIRDGNLWELAERRAAGHPALHAALQTLLQGADLFLGVEPESRGSFRILGSLSRLRPAVERMNRRLSTWRKGKGPFRRTARIPPTASALRRIPALDAAGKPIWWESPTPLGWCPVELSDIYPAGPAIGPDSYDEAFSAADPPLVERAPPTPDPSANLHAWTARQIVGLLEWSFGSECASQLSTQTPQGERSHRSGRLRTIRVDGAPAFIVGRDGLPRPTWRGARALHVALPAPRSRVVVAPDAVPFVERGRTLFSAFVQSCDPGLVPGSSALLVDGEDRLIAVGRLVLAPEEMGRLRRGVAVRVTAHERSPVPTLEPEEPPLAP